MKEYPQLWETLEIDKNRLSTIRKDWSEGKVPDLPYTIIGQTNLKEQIGEKLRRIDEKPMETSILQAQYGDGKTNVLKYLELYFRINKSKIPIQYIYCRANQDQTDLCMFLMQHIQASCLEILVKQIKELAYLAGFTPAAMVNNYEGDFAFIKEYTERLFQKENDEETLNNLVYLGTGRLYSQAIFKKYGLNKLTDFNRREVFVLFMNILACAGYYVVFAIDELEKINDKSPKRMAHYFTSYRELLDLFNKIDGHYLLTAITNGVNLAELSQPFYERAKKDIVTIDRIQNDNEIEALIKLMAELLNISVNDTTKKTILGKVKKKLSNNNRLTIQLISESLQNKKHKPIDTVSDQLTKKTDLKKLYDETKARIEAENGFSNLSRSIFDPLEYYLTALGYQENNSFRRDYQAIVDSDTNKAFFFLFNDDTKIKSRIEEFVQVKGITDFVVFAGTELDITYSKLDIPEVNIEIVEYDPHELFILLNMYRWNFDKQKEISVLLGLATNNVFD